MSEEANVSTPEGGEDQNLGEGTTNALIDGGGTTPAPTDFLSSIPEPYRDKPYMKNIKSQDDFYKQFDEAQGLIGSPRPPKQDAPEGEWNKFYSLLGKPEKSDDYGFIKEGLSEEAVTLNKQLQDKLFELNITKDQATGLQELINGMTEQSKQGQEKAAEEFNKQYQDELTKVFGDKKEESEEVAKNLISKYAPDTVKTKLNDLDADSMAAVAAVLKGISDEYITSDDINSIRNNTPASDATTVDEMKAELREAMSDPNFKNPMAGASHKAAVEKVTKISRAIANKEATDSKK